VSVVDIPIIDTDSHVTEPPDLWTSRLPARYQDDAPRVAWDDETSEHRWVIGDEVASPVGVFATAGWKEYLPSYPPSLAEADAGAFGMALAGATYDAILRHYYAGVEIASSNNVTAAPPSVR